MTFLPRSTDSRRNSSRQGPRGRFPHMNGTRRTLCCSRIQHKMSPNRASASGLPSPSSARGSGIAPSYSQQSLASFPGSTLSITPSHEPKRKCSLQLTSQLQTRTYGATQKVQCLFIVCLTSILSLLIPTAMLAADPELRDFPVPRNTESQPAAGPLPSQVAARSFSAVDPFHVEVFAAEPTVQNPIDMAWDAQGRIWTAENFTYAERSVRFDLRFRDRVTILEDTTGDGRCDKRTIFADNLQRLTSVQIGHGGVWLMAPPAATLHSRSQSRQRTGRTGSNRARRIHGRATELSQLCERASLGPGRMALWTVRRIVPWATRATRDASRTTPRPQWRNLALSPRDAADRGDRPWNDQYLGT